MNTIKQEIPNENVLELRLQEVFTEELQNFLAGTDATRATVIKSQTRLFLAIGAFILVSLGFSFIGDLPFYTLELLLVLVSISIFVQGKLWLKSQAKLTEEINIALLPTLAKVLGHKVEYQTRESHETQTKELFSKSELLTDSLDSLTTEDSYSISTPMISSVREVWATKRVQNGKNSNTITVFKGLLVTSNLNKSLNGKTFVSTEGDKNGFAHQSFWSRILGTGEVKVTELEWNEFERDLHVATSDGVEARYVLTPNFMQHLHKWWSEYKENIRIVFREDKMYMLLPDPNVKIGYSTASTDPAKLHRYLLSVARPLWRVLTLVEDIRL